MIKSTYTLFSSTQLFHQIVLLFNKENSTIDIASFLDDIMRRTGWNRLTFGLLRSQTRDFRNFPTDGNSPSRPGVGVSHLFPSYFSESFGVTWLFAKGGSLKKLIILLLIRNKWAASSCPSHNEKGTRTKRKHRRVYAHERALIYKRVLSSMSALYHESSR